jgi:hypothetical protein
VALFGVAWLALVAVVGWWWWTCLSDELIGTGSSCFLKCVGPDGQVAHISAGMLPPDYTPPIGPTSAPGWLTLLLAVATVALGYALHRLDCSSALRTLSLIGLTPPVLFLVTLHTPLPRNGLSFVLIVLLVVAVVSAGFVLGLLYLGTLLADAHLRRLQRPKRG